MKGFPILLFGLAAWVIAAADRALAQPAVKLDPATATLVKGNTRFALDLYAKLRAHKGNLFFSPYSISTALAMTYTGARDQTAKEMADTLHLDLGQERLPARVCGEAPCLEPIAELVDDIQAARADRAGRAQNDHTAPTSCGRQ